MFDAYLNKVFIRFRTDGIGSSVVVFFHIESDTDILARFMIKFSYRESGRLNFILLLPAVSLLIEFILRS